MKIIEKAKVIQKDMAEQATNPRLVPSVATRPAGRRRPRGGGGSSLEGWQQSSTGIMSSVRVCVCVVFFSVFYFSHENT